MIEQGVPEHPVADPAAPCRECLGGGRAEPLDGRRRQELHRPALAGRQCPAPIAITRWWKLPVTLGKRGQERLREAAKLGFVKLIIPRANQPKAKISGLDLLPVERVDQAVQLLRNL